MLNSNVDKDSKSESTSISSVNPANYPVNDFAITGGFILNEEDNYYLINISKIITDKSLFKLVFEGIMFKIENFIDLNEEILSTDGPIQLTEQKNIVIGIEIIANEINFIKEINIAKKMGRLNIGPEIYISDIFNSFILKKMLSLNISKIINFKKLDKKSKMYLFLTDLLDNLNKPEQKIGFIVMEPLTNGTFIEKCLNKTNILGPQGQQCNKVCDKIKELYKQNIIHNDLHQNNIMFNSSNEPRIIDFGQSIDLNTNDTITVDDQQLTPEDFIKYIFLKRKLNSGFINKFIESIQQKNIINIENIKYENKFNMKNDSLFIAIVMQFLRNRYYPSIYGSLPQNLLDLIEINKKTFFQIIPYFAIKNPQQEFVSLNTNSFLPYFQFTPNC